MRVDQIRDGIGAEIGEGVLHLRSRYADAGVNQHLAIGPGQDGNVAAGAFQNADIVSQPVRDDRRNCRAVLDQADKAARLDGHSRGVSHPVAA
jgi:hypothetical protein